jgi:hypothetical protein
MFEIEQIPLDFCPVVKGKKQITSHELRELLRGKRIKLDCGHYFQLHPLSNTLVMTAHGETMCHNCYD